MKNEISSLPLSPTSFQKKLIRWFDAHGRKDLPWQKNKTPYRVWVSEIMLQQTQVTTVISYYERFMARFPDVETLAKTDEDTVLHFWAGLGYYHRARSLHSASKKIFFDYANQFPNDLHGLQTLPGVGRSTAAAILSLAYHQPAAILDGNVKRVLSRIHHVNEWPIEKKLWEIAEKYAPKKRAADYSQAMMDLGASLCKRGKPRCEACPFQKNCIAHALGTEKNLPLAKPRKKIPVRTMTFFLIQRDQEILLEKRPAKGIWSGLYSFPEAEGVLQLKDIQKICRQRFKISSPKIKIQQSFRHTFTHFHLDIFPVSIKISSKIKEDPAYFWLNAQKSAKIGVPAPVKNLLNQLEIEK